jgi:hypothetical protein
MRTPRTRAAAGLPFRGQTSALRGRLAACCCVLVADVPEGGGQGANGHRVFLPGLSSARAGMQAGHAGPFGCLSKFGPCLFQVCQLLGCQRCPRRRPNHHGRGIIRARPCRTFGGKAPQTHVLAPFEGMSRQETSSGRGACDWRNRSPVSRHLVSAALQPVTGRPLRGRLLGPGCAVAELRRPRPCLSTTFFGCCPSDCTCPLRPL